jgi:hypothetical protein
MLKVSDIQPYDINNLIYPYETVVPNNIGTISQCVTNVTWNINLETVLGDLYKEYDYFNLEVLQIMTVPMTGGNGATFKPLDNSIYIGYSYRNLNVFISGLQWLAKIFFI